LDDRHAATKAKVSLGQFEADIAAPEHDQMWRQVVELQSLNMSEGSGGFEARNARNCRVRSAVNHVALALANLYHVGRDGTRRCTELRGVMRQMCDPRAANLILAGQAGDVGAGAPWLE
jgi:hypothetical protein